MKDLLTKLRILRQMLGSAFEEWREYIWANDLDAHYCCDGNPMECGCGGATWRDIYASKPRPTPSSEPV
jgi:hypothetical protein